MDQSPEKITVEAGVTIKINAYRVVSEAIERGLELGYNRAHKHTDTPDRAHIFEQQESAIMGELSEYIEWGE